MKMRFVSWLHARIRLERMRRWGGFSCCARGCGKESFYFLEGLRFLWIKKNYNKGGLLKDSMDEIIMLNCAEYKERVRERKKGESSESDGFSWDINTRKSPKFLLWQILPWASLLRADWMRVLLVVTASWIIFLDNWFWFWSWFLRIRIEEWWKEERFEWEGAKRVELTRHTRRGRIFTGNLLLSSFSFSCHCWVPSVFLGICFRFPFLWVCRVLMYSMDEFYLGKNRTLFFYYLNIPNHPRLYSLLLSQSPTHKKIIKTLSLFSGQLPEFRHFSQNPN